MLNKQNTNEVSQSNNIVKKGDVAGRDIYKNINHYNTINIDLSGTKNYQTAIDKLNGMNIIPEWFIKAIFSDSLHIKFDVNVIEEKLMLLDIFKDSLFSNLYDTIEESKDIAQSEYKNNLENEYLKEIIVDAGICIKNMDFSKAHQLFSDALNEVGLKSKISSFLYKEYLITGFIHYCRQNDMNGLKTLLRQKRPIETESDVKIDYVFTNIFQEICSRSTDIDSLKQTVLSLNKIYQTASSNTKSQTACSLGLAYRRLGERLDIEYLEKAIEIFEEGLELNDKDSIMEIQLRDHMAITYVRIFEFTNVEVYLIKAERLLKECIEIFKLIHNSKDRILIPRVLNNMGNVFKQRVLIFDDYVAASKAISYYDKAAEIWNEKDSPYEWGLLKKNIGETKYALGKITDDKGLLVEAIEDCIIAMKYRDIENSPYQWGKSMVIIFSSILLLVEMKSIKLIPSENRTKIIAFIKEIKLRKGQWNSSIFNDFEKNALEVENCLVNN